MTEEARVELWLDISTVGSKFEIQKDARSSEPRYRWRTWLDGSEWEYGQQPPTSRNAA